LLGRRRFPVAAPVSLWLLAAALSFVDGRLVVFTVGVYAAGMAAALLLGNLADPRRSRIIGTATPPPARGCGRVVGWRHPICCSAHADFTAAAVWRR
ncbi:MAG: sensor histidine kinase, partial [Solirubrobacterales bacterium]|nr:sensor histidine kinase [Solirubrobacterales bacterium]